MNNYVTPAEISVPSGASGVFGAASNIGDVISSASRKASTAMTASNEAMRSLKESVTSLSAPSSSVSVPFPVNLTPIDYASRSTLGDLNLDTDLPDNTVSDLTLTTIPSFTALSVPSVTFSTPSFSEPTVPTQQVRQQVSRPSINTDIPTPTAPSLDLPAAPALADINIPTAPNTTLPEFDYTLSDIITSDPVAMTWSPNAYNSDIWSDMVSKVLNDIRNGGTGLDVTVEQELYDRALARQQLENDRLYQETEAKFGSSGFDLPNGALTSALLQVSNQITRNNTEINGQITIDQAKLAQDNTHFILDKGIQLEGMVREFYHQEETRLLDAAKTIASISIEAVKIEISRYNAKVEKYKADAAVFEARTRATLVDIEIFKGEIEGAKLTADTQKLLVDIYNSRLAALDTQVKLYATEVEAANDVMAIEKTKIEIYQADIQAYVSQLEADKINFDIYATKLKGEETKAGIYDTQVRSHAVLVDIEKAKANIKAIEADIITKDNATKVSKYQADLQSYLASIELKAKIVAIQVEGFKAEAMAYDAETGAWKSENESKIAEMKNSILKYDSDIRKAIGEVESASRNFEALSTLKVKAAEGVANVSAQVAASALGGVHTTASLSSASNESISSNATISGSLTETHQFNESSV